MDRLLNILEYQLELGEFELFKVGRTEWERV